MRISDVVCLVFCCEPVDLMEAQTGNTVKFQVNTVSNTVIYSNLIL